MDCRELYTAGSSVLSCSCVQVLNNLLSSQRYRSASQHLKSLSLSSSSTHAAPSPLSCSPHLALPHAWPRSRTCLFCPRPSSPALSRPTRRSLLPLVTFDHPFHACPFATCLVSLDSCFTLARLKSAIVYRSLWYCQCVLCLATSIFFIPSLFQREREHPMKPI
jgi:hypothetical protein